MKKLTIALIILSFITIVCYGGWSFTWGGQTSVKLACAGYEVDSGYLIIGTSYFLDDSSNIFILKINTNGKIIDTAWVGYNTSASSVVPTIDGFLIAGDFFYESESRKDVLLVKIDKEGNVLWQKKYVTKYMRRALQIISNNTGEYYIFGVHYDWIHLNEHLYVLKVNSSGEEQWDRVLNIGDNNLINVRGVFQNRLNRFILLLNKESTDHEKYRSSIIEINEKGKYVKNIFEIEEDRRKGKIIQNLLLSANNNIILVGSEKNDVDNYDIWFAELNTASKEFVWECKYDFETLEAPMSIEQLANDEYLLIGNVGKRDIDDDIFLTRIDKFCELKWSKRLGQINYREFPGHLSLTSDGGCLITGGKSLLTSRECDVYIIKIDKEELLLD